MGYAVYARTSCSILTSVSGACGCPALGVLSRERSGCRHTSPSSCSAESFSAALLPMGICTLSRGICKGQDEDFVRQNTHQLTRCQQSPLNLYQITPYSCNAKPFSAEHLLLGVCTLKYRALHACVCTPIAPALKLRPLSGYAELLSPLPPPSQTDCLWWWGFDFMHALMSCC